MATITDIKVQKNNKSRANLYIDGEFAFGIEMLTVMQMGLKIGKEVSQAQLEQAVTESDKSVAFGKAVDYLSRAMKTESQMRKYLAGKGYSAEVVDEVTEKLKSYGYVDDRRYVELYVSENSKSKGAVRIKNELYLKGVSRQTVDELVTLDGDVTRESASALAEKYMRSKEPSPANVQKLQRYLLSRGYDFDTVGNVARKYRNDDEY